MFAHAPTQVKPVVGFQFVALPVELLRRNDLSAAAKLLAAVVMDNARSSRSGVCKLTNAGLGARIGRSAASVKRLLAELEAAGVVRRDHVAEKHQRTAVVPTWTPARESTTPRATTDHPPARERATLQTPGVRPVSDGDSSLDSRGTTEEKPSPAEVAAAIRGMFGRVGMAAKAGAGFVRRDRRPPCPVPRDAADLARMRAARAESLRNREPFGGMANLGKL